MSLHNIVTEVLSQMVKEHNDALKNTQWYNLTERDLIMFAYQKLKERVVDYRIHSELRPYDREQGKVIVGKNEHAEWVRYTSNTGAKFDLCIIDMDTSLIESLPESISPKYGRAPTYHRKAFKSVIEFKVRATGNRKRIRMDFQKLSLMCRPPSTCTGYFVILDGSALGRTLENIEEEFRRIKEDSSARMHYFDNRPEA